MKFSHYDTIPACDRQTHRQIHDNSIYHASIVSHGKTENRVRLWHMTSVTPDTFMFQALSSTALWPVANYNLMADSWVSNFLESLSR